MAGHPPNTRRMTLRHASTASKLRSRCCDRRGGLRTSRGLQQFFVATTPAFRRLLARRRAARTPSLRAFVSLVVPSIALLIVIIAASMVASTRGLESSVTELGIDGRRALYFEEVESALLRYHWFGNVALYYGDSDAAAARADELRRIGILLERASASARTPEQRRDVAGLRARVDRYFAIRAQLEASGESFEVIANESRGPLNEALEHVTRSQRRYLDQLWNSEQRAHSVVHRASIAGATVIVLVLLGAVLLVIVFERYVVMPLDRVRCAIAEFRASGTPTRAEEAGPVEIREIARTLNETTAALAEERKRQLAFVAGVAHDLRSPLTAVTLAATLLEELEPGLQRRPASARALAQVGRNAERLRRMIDDLMDVTRSEAGELRLTLRDVDLREPAREIVDLYARDEREHRLVLQVPDEPIFVCGDVVRLEQVVVNLVSNAIKYSPRGGTIRVVVEKTATDAILSVSDEGVGIPERDVDVIFEPFHRAGPSRDLAPGAGLGLSILARIVRAHGGRVEVQSKVGRGSTFYVVLPLAASPEECSAGPSDPSR